MLRMYFVKVSVVFIIIFIVNTALADVFFIPKKSNAYRIPEYAHILIAGEITSGDVGRLRNIIKKRLNELNSQITEQPIVLLDSPGGDVSAALEMGRLLRNILAFTVVDGGASCNSACVFLLAGGVSRNLYLDGRIGLHRPRFDYGQFANLTKDQAASTYEKLKSECSTYMKEMGISDQVFYDMLKIPSQDVKFVNREYAKRTGLVGYDPAWEEWTRALSVKRQGEARVKALDRLVDCYNKGVKKAICEKRYENEIKSLP